VHNAVISAFFAFMLNPPFHAENVRI